MIEVYNAWQTLPWNVQLMCLCPLAVLPMLWLLSPKRTHPWAYKWERHIDEQLTLVRKKYKGESRRAAYENTFAKLIVELETQTGSANFLFLSNPEHRNVWMYLYRKIHYTL